MTNNGIKKTAAAIVCLIILAAAAVFIIDALSDSFNVVFYPETNKTQQQPDPEPMPEPDPTPEPEPSLVQLAAPIVTYDQETNLLSWSEVENASGYRVTINEQTEGYGADTTEIEVTIDEGDSYTMSVQALGDGETYSNSEISTITGERENLDQMYYELIEDNIYKFFEDYLFSNRYKVQIQDVLNIDLQNNIFSILLKANNEGSANTYYRTFNFDLSNYKDYSNTQITLKELAEVSNFIKDYDEFVSSVTHASAAYNFGDDLYNKLISDNLLTGELKNYINNGYTLTKLYSEPNMGNEPDNFIVDSCIKLQNGNDIKVVTVQNKISQKYNGSYAFDGYVNAYIDGTADDVTIEERSFTEASPVSSIWQAANDKYGSQQAQVTNS